MNRGLGIRHDAKSIAEISEMISKTFKEFALWQAAMHKFHAYGAPDSDPVSRRDPPTNTSPAKRQRLESGGYNSLLRNTSSEAPEEEHDTDHMRAEVQQLMAGFCSR